MEKRFGGRWAIGDASVFISWGRKRASYDVLSAPSLSRITQLNKIDTSVRWRYDEFFVQLGLEITRVKNSPIKGFKINRFF